LRAAGLRAAGLIAVALSARSLWSKLRARRAGARLDGQVALVTGGSRGLGLLIARELAGEGCRVAICARDRDELERARRDLEAHGAADPLALLCDLSRPNEVAALVAEVIGHFGSIDVLVNSAGIVPVRPAAALDPDDFHHAMSTIFWGTVLTTMAVLPHMRARRRGRVVDVTSVGGKGAVPHLLPYDCAKLAAAGFSDGLRAEAARDGVSVTTVIPGLAISAQRSARMIVDAAKRRDPRIVLGTPAKLLRLFEALFPGLAARTRSVGNRLLPAAR
jgi:NAD(P)-dependent dehydrogenase (short-subunit alcohol dehydrogenase family)